MNLGIWTILLALAAYTAMSLVAFAAFGFDKFRAKVGTIRRTPEATLHTLSFLGGFPGSLAAMRVFRHKTAKPGFLRTTLLAAAVHILAWCVLGLLAVRAD